MASSTLKGLVANSGKLGYQLWHRPLKMASLVYEREIGIGDRTSFGRAKNGESAKNEALHFLRSPLRALPLFALSPTLRRLVLLLLRSAVVYCSDDFASLFLYLTLRLLTPPPLRCIPT